MATRYTSDEELTSVANAIRSKTGTSSTLSYPNGFVNSIENIVTINDVPNKAAATYTPTTSDQTIDAGEYLMGTQTIKGDANLVAANIKSGISIFGVSGTLSGGGLEGHSVTVSNTGSYSFRPAVIYADGTYFQETISNGGSKTYQNVAYVLGGDIREPGGNLITDAMDSTIVHRNGGWSDYILVVKPNSDSARVLYDCTCLTGDTLIVLADYTTKRIDEIEVGDFVLSIDPVSMKLEADEVTYSDATKYKHHVEYDYWIFEDGYNVKTVHRHRFYNIEQQCMKYLDEWKIGEHAYTVNGKTVALLSHDNIKEPVYHYTIFTKNQNYFANGMLSGNRHTQAMTIKP